MTEYRDRFSGEWKSVGWFIDRYTRFHAVLSEIADATCVSRCREVEQDRSQWCTACFAADALEVR